MNITINVDYICVGGGNHVTNTVIPNRVFHPATPWLLPAAS